MDIFLQQFWPWIIAGLDLLLATVTSSHAVLRKRDSRAAAGWVGLIWLTPFAGSMLYIWLGINRIERKAHRLRPAELADEIRRRAADHGQTELECELHCGHLQSLAGLVGRMTGQPLCSDNQVTCLPGGGDAAYAAMLAAIDNATTSISLCVYIFANDRAGRVFAESLIRATKRGVNVRVLVDDVGSGYSWRSGTDLFENSSVTVARFLPTLTPWRFQYSNLRNHRKVLIVDGSIGFTGGMNICEVNYRDIPEEQRAQDVHFELHGAVVHQLQDAFVLDWSFTTGERLSGGLWYGPIESNGSVLARVISDGPDEDLDRLQSVILGAISCAKSHIVVVMAYFVPDHALISALNMAAWKGVQVDIVLPSQVDVRLVRWASTAVLPHLLGSGCRIWLSEPPFDHSKLAVIDDTWSLIGSANWDQRSLRLNFELNVECYDAALAGQLTGIAESRMATATRVTTEWLQQQSLAVRLRNGLASLAAPFL